MIPRLPAYVAALAAGAAGLALALAPGALVTLCPMPEGDDTARAQTAIAAASAGDTVLFAPGLYRLRTVTLKSGVALRGQGARLLALRDDPVFALDPADSHDIRIDGLTFVGTGKTPVRGVVELVGDGSANSARDIVVTGARFENNGLFFVDLRRSRIDGNSFFDIGEGGAAIGGYRADHSSFSRNVLRNVWQGVSLIQRGGPEQGRNIVVDGNKGEGVSRMAIEIQGSDPPAPVESQGLRVTRNHFTRWVRPVADGNTIAFSIVTDGGVGTQVLGNYARGDVATGIGIEIAGTDALVSGNHIEGFDAGVIGYSPRETVTGNNIFGQRGAAVRDFHGGNLTIADNVADPGRRPPEGVEPAARPDISIDDALQFRARILCGLRKGEATMFGGRR